MSPTIGSIATGYGGLDLAVEAVTGAETAWVCDPFPGPSAVLAHRFPGVPNLGDAMTLDWSAAPRADILTAGYPCQPFSAAGKRVGHDDPRNLWPSVVRAIRGLGPRLVVLENVRGHLTRGFDVVLGSLADLGYDARWVCLRASDVGAAHRRERLFIVATPVQDSDVEPWDQWRLAAPGQAEGGRAWADAGRRGNASAADATGTARGGPQLSAMAPPAGPAAEPRKRRREDSQCGGPTADTDGSRLAVGGIVPDNDGPERPAAGRGGSDDSWGRYGPAIARWEAVTGRPSPAPTRTGTRGAQALSAIWVEWLMGLPSGWVTDVPGLTRAVQLHLLGNGVVPQQAEAALRHLLES